MLDKVCIIKMPQFTCNVNDDAKKFCIIIYWSLFSDLGAPLYHPENVRQGFWVKNIILLGVSMITQKSYVISSIDICLVF
jgi:hypothetical protein